MKLNEFVDAFTANLAHEISDLGGSAATAKATINTLISDFKTAFNANLDGLNAAIGEVLDRHAAKANTLAAAARDGVVVLPSVHEAAEVDLDLDEDGAAEMAAKLAPRKAA